MNSKKLISLIIIVLGITFFGAYGYMQIEGWDFHDALYMSVITLTTTGFSEIHNLSTEGRSFTMFLLLVGVGTVTYSAAIIMNSVMSINFQERRRKKMLKKLEDLKRHTIVCGFGRMGNVICDELKKAESEFVVIERDEHVVAKLIEKKDLCIEGDASNEDCLKQAGIEKAKTLVCMIDNDADGLYVALAARTLNPDLYIIVRASSDTAAKRMSVAGADRVVLPFIVSGIKVAENILNPAVDDFLDINALAKEASERIQLIDIVLKDGSELIGKEIRDLKFREQGIMIVGIKREDEKLNFLPTSDYICRIGDCLLALGTKKSCTEITDRYLN